MMLKRSVLCLGLAGLWACGEAEPVPEVCPDTQGTICTWAGDGEAAFDGDGNGLLSSSFYWPVDITFASNGDTYILDWNNHRVRKLVTDGQSSPVLQTVIGTDFVGDGPPDQGDLRAPGVLGTTIDLNHPTQMVEMPDGKLTLIAWHNHKLREYDPATGLVLVRCGRGADFKGDNGPAAAALFNQPVSASLASDSSMFILDQRNQVIRKIDAAGMVTTVAGTPKAPGFEGDGGDPLLAKMSQPTGSNPPYGGSVVAAPDGSLYFSDVNNHRVRRVDLAGNTITTVAGTGTKGYGGDGGPGTAAQLATPKKLTIGPDGALYISDTENHRVRKLDLTSGVITTVAGNGTGTYAGDFGPATAASLNQPAGVQFKDGYMYIADMNNHRIRRVKL